MLGQPLVGSPITSVFIIIIKIIINTIKQNKIPKIEAIKSGKVENATILSKEYKNNHW